MYRLFTTLIKLALLLGSYTLSAQEYHFELGEKHFSENELTKSKAAFEVAKDSFILARNDTATALCFNYLAKVNLHQGNYQLGIDLNEEGLKYARRAPYSIAYLRLILFKSEYHYMKGNSEVGRACWREIENKIQTTNYVTASAYKSFATAYLKEPGDTFELLAQRGLETALHFKDSSQITNAYRLLAARAEIKSNIPASLSILLEGITYIPKSKLITRANYMLQISFCFDKLNDFKKSLSYAQQAYDIAKKTNYQLFYHAALTQLAKSHSELGDFDTAEKYWEQIIDFYTQKGKLNDVAVIQCAQLSSYIQRKKSRKVEEILTKLEAIDLSNIKPVNQNYINRTLTKYYFSINEINLAKEKFADWTKTKDQVVQLENQYEYVLYQSKFAEEEKLYGKSIALLEKSNSILDDIKRKKQKDVVYLIEAEYNTAEKEAKITALETQSRLKHFKVKQRNIFLILSSLFLVFASILTFIFYKRNQKIRLQKSEIKKTLEEKNILLSEIHSRVKNSLQTISSILNLQSRTMEEGIAAEAIKEGRNRVNSMAFIHDNLFVENNASQVNIKSYIDQLLEALFKSYNVKPDKILLEKRVMSGVVNVDKIIPIGLILNELISNALKHAFIGQGQGVLKVEFLKKENEFQLAVIDNGVGIQPKTTNSKGGFGSRIIQAFAKKLNANVTRTTGNGTSVIVSFSDLK